MFSHARAVCLALLVAPFFAACKGDSFTTVDLAGRAAYPPGFRASLGQVAPINTQFQVVDLARRAEEQVVAQGQTNSEGEYSVTIPVTTSVAVIVLGEVRVSGLIDPRLGSVGKDFNGTTDIACEAGVTAVTEGAITHSQLDEERIQNLEEGAAVVVQEQAIDYTDSDGSRARAAQRVRELTDDGDHGVD
jgi:hypothetical protein